MLLCGRAYAKRTRNVGQGVNQPLGAYRKVYSFQGLSDTHPIRAGPVNRVERQDRGWLTTRR